MASTTQDDYSALLSRLNGISLRIPDLTSLFRRRPAALDPHYTSLVRRVDAKLVELVPNPKTREKMTEVNLPLFASLWWPTANLHRLEAVVY
ncbi:hypothetical protein QBC43DRAFT_322740 [Cladorrhinum sp. PSN259]|nr:hypothetical protein QBC43DRAFT_322740 [Cladorrhinum sp. PSN259]